MTIADLGQTDLADLARFCGNPANRLALICSKNRAEDFVDKAVTASYTRFGFNGQAAPALL
jgi:hypothetical protein